MSFPLSRSSLPTRLVLVLLAGLLAAGVLSPSARAETPAPGRVGGLVLDRSNTPLPGATVTLTDAGTVAGSTTADDQGRWSVAAPQGDYDIQVSVQQGDHTSSAKVARYAVDADTKLNLIMAGDPDEAELRTAAADTGESAQEQASPTFTRAAATATRQAASWEAVTFSGRVVDADGDPVSRVGIRLFQENPYYFADGIVDDDGTFSLGTPAGTYALEVWTDVDEECPGCPYERRQQRTHIYFVKDFRLDGDRQETIRLPRPSMMTVTVVDPSNRPVEGAWVRNETAGWNQPPAIAPDLFPGATPNVFSYVDLLTGNDGTADIEYFPGAGPATLSVDPPPGTYLPTSTAFPSNTSSLKIRLQDGPTLHGRLLQADGTPLRVTDASISGEAGSYPIAVTPDGYAVTAPAGRYRMSMEVVHNEEGESSDYWIWRLETGEFEIVDDRALDLNVPLGQARLWVVDDRGQRIDDFDSYGIETTGDVTIADGIRASTRTTSEAWPDDPEYLAVIGPSLTQELQQLDAFAGAPKSAYVAPGEHTIIAFISGTGPGYAPLPTTTTTTTTTAPNQPPTPTTNGGAGSGNNPPAGPASQPAGTAAAKGYWALAADGHVYGFGDAASYGNGASGAVDLEPTRTGRGYWALNKAGRVQAFGDATHLGNVDTIKLAKGEEPASLAATPSGSGYWVFTNRGRTIAFGDAPFLGDMSQATLNGPVLGSVATPSGKGYYMVASDGGIFAFGDAAFAGSMGAQKLNAPVQSLVPDADGAGYWLVASDGGIFAFDAPFRGSMGGKRLNKPISGMVRYGDGYLMVGADGGIFNFSSLPFSGSLGDNPPTTPVVAIAALP